MIVPKTKQLYLSRTNLLVEFAPELPTKNRSQVLLLTIGSVEVGKYMVKKKLNKKRPSHSIRPWSEAQGAS